MQTLTVSCGICGLILAQVTKDNISDDDINLYSSMCSCDTDGQANILTGVTGNASSS